MAVCELPHASVARYVRVTRTTHPLAEEASPTNALRGGLRLSEAMTMCVSGAGMLPKHCTDRGPGAVIIGALVSCTVIVWVQISKLPQASVALYVRVIVMTQLFVAYVSPTKLFETEPHVSDDFTPDGSGGGTFPKH